MVYFHGVDAAQHRFWDCHNKTDSIFKHVIGCYYEFIDKILGELLQKISAPKTVFVTSDHGHEATKIHFRLLNAFLRREQVTGSHSSAPDGIFIASGSEIRQGIQLKDISLYDIVPTILPLFNLPVSKDMDGQPIEEIFSKYILPTKYIDSYEGLSVLNFGKRGGIEDNENILKRFKDLGYLD